MKNLLNNPTLILMEGAIVEQLRRSDGIPLHPRLANAPLIYSQVGRDALTQLYQGYIDIARVAHVPFLMLTPTWRAGKDRVLEAKLSQDINIDAAQFMHALRDSQNNFSNMIKIGGLLGCKHDAYRLACYRTTAKAV